MRHFAALWYAPPTMLSAIIFDFNGIIADDEPLHLEMFQKVLAEQGIPLFREEYYTHFLGMDDRDCFKAVLAARKRPADDALVDQLIAKKAGYYARAINERLIIFPGVKELIGAASMKYPLAIASGALRHEIEGILNAINLRAAFAAIVSAEDVRHGKPAPDCFVTALARLNERKGAPPIDASSCLVIEDSPWGVTAAHAAGMKCLAVTNSYPADSLNEADHVLSTLEGLPLAALNGLFDA
ncbi:MAG TPA: HAD family phosphatase [Nitrospiria bacterium]|nr:HAD family phosphatase [Nitrospiria bacterium]